MAFFVGILGTGSSANGYVVGCDQASLMVDNGFSLKETRRRLQQIGSDAASIRAILLTHAHEDHTRGVSSFAETYAVPVYAPRGLEDFPYRSEGLAVRPIPLYQDTSLGPFQVFGFSTKHDLEVSAGYRIRYQATSLTLITDTGMVDDTMLAQAQRSAVLVLEANYSDEMLWGGRYPQYLKERVAKTHLSNRQAGEFLAQLSRLSPCTREVVLVHLSENNNSPERAAAEVRDCLQGTPWEGLEILIAGRSHSWCNAPSPRLWVLPKRAPWSCRWGDR